MKLLNKFKERYNQNESYIARKDQYVFRIYLGTAMFIGGLFALGMAAFLLEDGYLRVFLFVLGLPVGIVGFYVMFAGTKALFYTDIVIKKGLVMYKLFIMDGSLFHPFREIKVKKLFETFADAEAYYENGPDWEIVEK